MDLGELAEKYDDLADVIIADPRLVRRVVKRDLLEQGHAIPGVVPHTHAYGVRRTTLDRWGLSPELELRAGSTKAHVILIAEPARRGRGKRAAHEVSAQVERATFHVAVHLLLERQIELGVLDRNVVLRRIDSLGRAEFEEVRMALEHDDLLLPPGNELEVYIEFAALFLELHVFEPDLLVTTFPGIDDVEVVLSMLQSDIDIAALCARAKAGAAPSRQTEPESVRHSLPPSPRTVGPKLVERWLKRAERHRRRLEDARALVLSARASESSDDSMAGRAEALARKDAENLSQRLRHALGVAGTRETERPTFSSMFEVLARGAASHAKPKASTEYRILRALERAVQSFENPGYVVHIPTWILSAGSEPAVRPREATHTLVVARHVEDAADLATELRLPRTQRAEAIELMTRARSLAKGRVRSTLRVRMLRVLRQVGLSPRSGPEEQGRSNLVEEMLDQVLERGFLSLSQWRDSVSRHELKLPDLSPRELYRGDPLLLADAKLSRELDGIYRRGDIYLRWLQKLSSLPFGTRIGRWVVMWFALPVLASFTILEGIRHIVGPVAEWFGAPPMQPFTWHPFAVTALLVLGFLHSEALRIVFRQLLDVLGLILGWIFFRIPKAVLAGLIVQRLLARPAFRIFLRVMVVPGLVAGATFWLSPVPPKLHWARFVIALGTFLVMVSVMTSRVGWWLEDFYMEQLAPAWSTLSQQWIPSLLRAIGRTFSVMMDIFDRASHRIGDFLRFRRSNSSFVLLTAGSVGFVWSIIAYVLRLYVTLLIEPEINPLKHFPVVTVAHKILLPFLPDLLTLLERPFSVLGSILGPAMAGITVFFLPSASGFLAWELKANYRLYRSTRPPFIGSVRFGPHGENLRELLVVGLHSGTLPKLYERLRRAAQREAASGEARTGLLGRSPGTARFQRRLLVLRHSLHDFAERELLPPLRATPRWPHPNVRVERVEASSNRVRVQIGAGTDTAMPLELTVEQLGGRLVASISRSGFIGELSDGERLIFENALAVFYHRAHIDLVREQLEAIWPGEAHYAVVDEGLVLWPARGYETECTFSLDVYRPKKLLAKVRGKELSQRPSLDSRRILYKHQRIRFEDWERAWHSSTQIGTTVPRLLKGASLLPPPSGSDAFGS